MRECGDCSLCCKILAIPKGEGFPFDKPINEWCKHCSPGNGCRVHGTPEFPKLCKGFVCTWLTNPYCAEELKPNKIHAVIMTRKLDPSKEISKDNNIEVIQIDPAYPVHPLVERMINSNRGRIRMKVNRARSVQCVGKGSTGEEQRKDAYYMQEVLRMHGGLEIDDDESSKMFKENRLIPVSAITPAE
jgi:hypothetical protein